MAANLRHQKIYTMYAFVPNFVKKDAVFYKSLMKLVIDEANVPFDLRQRVKKPYMSDNG